MYINNLHNDKDKSECVFISFNNLFEYTIPCQSFHLPSAGVMVKPQWLELTMSRTNLYGPKDVRVINVCLYV